MTVVLATQTLVIEMIDGFRNEMDRPIPEHKVRPARMGTLEPQGDVAVIDLK